MLLFIFTLLVTIIGIIILHLAKIDDYLLQIIGGVSSFGGGIVAFIMILMIIGAHVGVDATITKNQIEYDSLCERKELIASEYEDVSKSDILKDIAEWNQDVYSYKHWANNPWTSWFYSKRVADSMEMIE
jgi:hypothetical protein